ncbi:SDR family oxidoreductase [soil metagenome]
MSTSVWISGASRGIGAALVAQQPYSDAIVYDLSRSGGTPSTTHVPVDLADPPSWSTAAAHFAAGLAEHAPDRAVFVHNAATIEPMGPAGATDPAAYEASVLLNAAAPQALGAAFLAAVAAAGTPEATLAIISSGAATGARAGWSAYCAGKAAVEMWVRTVGLEQAAREHGVRVLAIAPGVIDTDMQALIRQQSAAVFPTVDRFVEMHQQGQLVSPEDAARDLWDVIANRDLPTGSVVDLRTFDDPVDEEH